MSPENTERRFTPVPNEEARALTPDEIKEAEAKWLVEPQENITPEEAPLDYASLSYEEADNLRTENSRMFNERRAAYIASIEPKMKLFEQNLRIQLRSLLEQPGHTQEIRDELKRYQTISPEEASARIGRKEKQGTDAHEPWMQAIRMLRERLPEAVEIQNESEEFESFQEKSFAEGRALSAAIKEKKPAEPNRTPRNKSWYES